MSASVAKNALTKYPTASFREMLALAIPLIISLISANLTIFIDRLFLSHYSLAAFEASAAAGGLFFFFQVTSLRFVSTVQTYVSHSMGAKKFHEAGSYTWQMLWFSLFSPVIVVPVGLLTGYFFFKGTPIEAFGSTYFNYLIWGNLLFALEGTFGAFFAGVGRTRLILYIHLVTHAINIALNYILIFGVEGIIPPLGLHGAAIGTLVSKTATCAIFTFYFVQSKGKGVNEWKLIPARFMECIKKALPRAVGQGAAIIAYNAAAHILIRKGGVDLLSCTFGVSIFLPLINDGMGHAFLSISSYLIGSKKWGLFPRLMRSTSIFILVNACLISIPFLLYPEAIIHLFEQKTFTDFEYQTLKNTCIWVAWCYLTNSVYVTSFMLMTAFKDTLFYMIIHPILTTITLYLPTLMLAEKSYWRPEWFWLINGIACLPPAVIYLVRCFYNFRACYLESQGQQAPSVQPIE